MITVNLVDFEFAFEFFFRLTRLPLAFGVVIEACPAEGDGRVGCRGVEFLGVSLVPPEMYRQVSNRRRHEPQQSEHHGDTSLRHPSLVAKRIGDGDVSVERNTSEMEQRSGRKHDVIGVEHVTESSVQRPATSDDDRSAEGHNENGNEKIGDGERNEKSVA